MKVTKCLYCNSDNLTYVTHRSDDNGIVRCEKCKVMMVENISDDTESLYTADYFEKSGETKSGYTNYLSSPVANLIGKYAFSSLFLNNKGNHLDLGCADGSLIEIFSSEGFASHGLEISKDAVKIARDKGLDVQFSTLHTFPKSVPRSDIITAFDLLEHADKPGNVLREVIDNLNDNGFFVFSTLSVRKNDPSDYWFNNSLEHYVYYNAESLNNILLETFGPNNYGFVEMEINGIAEFWGFGKKGSALKEIKILDLIKERTFQKSVKDNQASYFLSLFYNQVSEFDISEKIIKSYEKAWSQAETTTAKFYNYYFQGRFEMAVREALALSSSVPLSNAPFWQALSYAENELFKIQKKDLESEFHAEILELRERSFQLKNELYNLKNSRIVGGTIKLRSVFRDQTMPTIKGTPRESIRVAKKGVGYFLPMDTKKKIGQIKRQIKAKINDVSVTSSRPLSVQVIENQFLGEHACLVSVVIPFYNRANTIDDTLVSLSKQIYANFEVIIVNDGSTEPESIKKLDTIEILSLNGKIINQDNQGVAAARNNGIDQATGKYIICLDSDDMLEPTYIEKIVLVLESHPEIDLVTTDRQDFGVLSDAYKAGPYDPIRLYDDNMVITAAAFKKVAWEQSGGYKKNIGYEDWEYWLSLAENGFWGKHIPELLFKYRTSMQSRYVEDKDVHWNNIKTIQTMHKDYRLKVKSLMKERFSTSYAIDPVSAFINVAEKEAYKGMDENKKTILITIPWMTFGGAETLIYNYCREIKDQFNLAFVTNIPSEHEWEYKFTELTPHIYHMDNLFETTQLKLNFLSNYIQTRNVDILHIIHNGFTFEMLPEIKERHPHLKVVVTMFNDRVEEYVTKSKQYQSYIDEYVTDNNAVAQSFKKMLNKGANIQVIPNGINCYDEFNRNKFKVREVRKELNLRDEDIAVFFVGRLSEEKNPDVFLSVAENIAQTNESKKIKFFIIGDGPMRLELEETISKMDDKVHVSNLGYQADVAKYLSAADIFVLPSSIEGFPLSILEAMAMEVVVVASDVGAVSDVINSGVDGFVVSPGSDTEITEAILLLCNNPQKLKTFKMLSRAKVETKYSNVILGENYKRLYRDIMK